MPLTDDTILKWALGLVTALLAGSFAWLRQSLAQVNARIDAHDLKDNERHREDDTREREELGRLWDAVNTTRREQAEFQLHAWQQFATKDDLKGVENRILSAIDSLRRGA